MLVRSVLLCDDLRFETSGQLTAVGIYGEVVPVAWADGRGEQTRLVVMVVVSGLRGEETVEYRMYFDPDEEPPTRLASDRHDPRFDQHILVSIREPMVYRAPGRHVVRLVVKVGASTLTYEHPFEVQAVSLDGGTTTGEGQAR